MRGFSGTSGPFRGASPFGPFSSSLPSSDLPGLFQMPPGNDPSGPFLPRNVPSVNDPAPVPTLFPQAGQCREEIQSPVKVRGHRLTRLDLHGKKISFPLQEKVDLVAGPVLPEGPARFLSSVQPSLQEFSHDKGFEKGPKEGVRDDLVGGLDSQEPGDQTRIREKKFGGLEEALVEILVVGREEKQKATGFKDGKPGAYRVVGQTAVVGEG